MLYFTSSCSHLKNRSNTCTRLLLSAPMLADMVIILTLISHPCFGYQMTSSSEPVSQNNVLCSVTHPSEFALRHLTFTGRTLIFLCTWSFCKYILCSSTPGSLPLPSHAHHFISLRILSWHWFGVIMTRLPLQINILGKPEVLINNVEFPYPLK